MRAFAPRLMGGLAFCLLPIALAAQDHAPLPESLLKAKTAHLVNESGDLKAYDNFYKELKKWNHFTIVTSRESAEIIMVLATGTNGAIVSGPVISPTPTLELKILDPATNGTLWSDATDKWMTSGHAPSKLVSNLKKRMPKR